MTRWLDRLAAWWLGIDQTSAPEDLSPTYAAGFERGYRIGHAQGERAALAAIQDQLRAGLTYGPHSTIH